MDALLCAFIAGALAETGDKTQLLALALGLHFRRFIPVIAGIALAALANMGLAAIAGAFAAPLLTHQAATLLLALALLFAAFGALWRQEAAGPIDRWRLGAFGTSLIAFFIVELGDKSQFLSFAIAARSGSPWLTMIGATAGIALTSAAAILVGRDFAQIAPVRAIRTGAGILFLIAGMIAALSALRLI
ncbi:TMEM165/GDT1 family protein [Sphingobium boeckii]|uniref:GDT1 family protein n=1 Tax=Sphingobium boeckii TaxID=1082345 RepID=A0A7W9EFS0_9SPHN|nr:TMEM165/GDT1 family protein [Sphingobium boeckii]MBB5687557.1 putative Ca2+/H+ antiporter (TMEM165/GDT1 family) [Sphingobium boeckii]